jgi:hypothetical protein
MTARIEPISKEEVMAADMQRWRHAVLTWGAKEYGDRVKADRLFQGPAADRATELLDAVYQKRTLTPGTELVDGVTVAAVIGEDAETTLRLLYHDLSRRQRIGGGERRYAVGEDGAGTVETRWIISEDCIVLGDPTAREKRLRRLPWSSDTFHDDGMRIVLESVGNTSYTTGVYVYVHRDGAEEAERGYLSFSAAFDAEGRFFWRRNAIRGLHGPDIEDADILAAVERQLAQWSERDPVRWMFHAHGAIHQELDPYTRKRRETEEAVADLEAAKAGKPNWRRYADYTPEQLDRALAWRRRDLADLDRVADRMRTLRAASETISAWVTKGTPENGMPIRLLVPFAEAAASPGEADAPSRRM